jgi:Flavoprotein
MTSTVGVVASGAGGVELLRPRLVDPLLSAGRQVAVTLTPTAAHWLDAVGEVDKLAAATGLPVRSEPRLPGEPRPHPRVDVYVVAPATANTVAKLALGIADNQALTLLCESFGTTPMIVFPRINAAHARNPGWHRHLDALSSAGVHLVYGDDVWPLYEPREAPSDRDLPWPEVLKAVDGLLPD